MTPMTSADRIAVIQRTRAAGAAAFVNALSHSDNASSEQALSQHWLAEMRKDSNLLPDGWYQPPPGGVSVLIGRAPRYERLTYDSLRDPRIWPRDDHTLSAESLVYAYASPTDRHSGLIGDLGMTLYRGASKAIHDHLTSCLKVSTQVAAYAEVGMELRDLFHHAQKTIRDIDPSLSNFVTSITDAGASNIGHTIPWSYEGYSPEVVECLEQGSTTDIADMIKSRRVFLNASSREQVKPTMAFTVEPRIASPSLPLSSYHLIVTFLEGKRRICSNLAPIFKLFGMDQYLPQDVLGYLDET